MCYTLTLRLSVWLTVSRRHLVVAVFVWRILKHCAALQLSDKYRIATPVNWKKGDDVIVHASVSNEEAKTLFPEHQVFKVSLYFWLMLAGGLNGIL